MQKKHEFHVLVIAARGATIWGLYGVTIVHWQSKPWRSSGFVIHLKFRAKNKKLGVAEQLDLVSQSWILRWSILQMLLILVLLSLWFREKKYGIAIALSPASLDSPNSIPEGSMRRLYIYQPEWLIFNIPGAWILRDMVKPHVCHVNQKTSKNRCGSTPGLLHHQGSTFSLRFRPLKFKVQGCGRDRNRAHRQHVTCRRNSTKATDFAGSSKKWQGA